jgi:hypothetical protein
MPADRLPDAVPTWVIRSVAVRTRDGPARLDQAYRRLMDSTPRGEPPPLSPGRPQPRADGGDTPAVRR